MLVSSANKTDRLVVDIMVKSLMYSKKSSEPKIDPCGTLHFTFSLSDLTLLYIANDYTDTYQSNTLDTI